MKIKPATIAGDEDIDDESENALNISIKDESMKGKSFEIDEMGKREHLETKKQIEELRKEYGVDWLNSKAATKVQNVMGIQASPANIANDVAKSPQTTEKMLERLFGMNTSSTSSNQQRSSTPIQNYIGLGHTPTEVIVKVLQALIIILNMSFLIISAISIATIIFRGFSKH